MSVHCPLDFVHREGILQPYITKKSQVLKPLCCTLQSYDGYRQGRVFQLPNTHLPFFLVNCILTLNQYTKTPNLWDRDHENQHHEYFLCPSVFPVPFRIPYLQRGQMPTDLSPPTTDSVYLLRNTTRKHYLNFWHVFVYDHWDYYVTRLLLTCSFVQYKP